MSDDLREDLLATRRAKLERLRADGIDPFPASFPGVGPIAGILQQHVELPDGTDTQDAYRVAGRIHARRGQGKMAFIDLDDRSGRIQLQAKLDVLGEERMERLLALDLGDLVGIDGTAFRSRRGELTLRVDDFTVLAKSLRPPPDKHHGLADVELRHRRRELDLMTDEEARQVFIDRARIVSSVRRTLDGDGFVEVETPVLQPLYGGALARPFTTHHNALDRTLYLRIATELYLKRLIVGGLERVYELGKDFRNEGVSPRHNPEFTMIEWYEAYGDYTDGMRRTEEVVAAAAAAIDYEGEVSFAAPWPRIPLATAIQEHAGIDVLAHRDDAALSAAIAVQGLELPTADRTWPQLVDDLLSKYVEPTLQTPTFLTDYPIELSPFAKADPKSDPAHAMTERFEAFCFGMEIANGYSELNDPDEQRARFEAQVRLAAAGDDETAPYDEVFVQALEQGMPPTAGVGLGIDRLVMVLTGRRSIREVVLFPAMRD